MEKPKKVSLGTKSGKTGAQMDLERIRELKAAQEKIKELENAKAIWKLNYEGEKFSAVAWKADFDSMSQAFHAKSNEAQRLSEINDSLNQQLLLLSRKGMDLKSSSLQPTQGCVGESDPSGKSSHEPGSKLDMGKQRAGLVLGGFQNALKAVVEVGTFGANKYTDNGWRSVDGGLKRYEDALWRHLLERGCDEQSGLPHRWHALWNMMALIELDFDSK
jgi:hypothetical protein